MSKKQENKKLIKQNKRNQIINKSYRSTIKTLGKLFFLKIKMFLLEIEQEKKEELKKEVQQLIKNFYSIVDKAVKKNVIHQNSAARKKSKIGKLFSTI